MRFFVGLFLELDRTNGKMLQRKEILTVIGFYGRDGKSVDRQEDCTIVMVNCRIHNDREDPGSTYTMSIAEFDDVPEPVIGDQLIKETRMWLSKKGDESTNA